MRYVTIILYNRTIVNRPYRAVVTVLYYRKRYRVEKLSERSARISVAADQILRTASEIVWIAYAAARRRIGSLRNVSNVMRALQNRDLSCAKLEARLGGPVAPRRPCGTGCGSTVADCKTSSSCSRSSAISKIIG